MWLGHELLGNFYPRTRMPWEHDVLAQAWGLAGRRYLAKKWKKLLDELGLANKIDWFNAVVDSSSVRALFGGVKPSPNPTDRGKYGSKRHVISDGKGIPLAVIHTGDNVHDSQQAIALEDAIPAIKPSNSGRRRRQ